MIKLSFKCQGRELKFGAGVNDELSRISNTLEANTGLVLEHWEVNGDDYHMWFVTNALHELLMTKGEVGYNLIDQPSGISLYKSQFGLRDIKWEEDHI